MTLEQKVQEKVNEFLQSDAIEKKVEQALDKAISDAVNELFSGYRAPAKEAIKKQLESQMIPIIEKHDYSKFIVKLDAILVDVLKNTTLENKNILENFKDFASFHAPEKITITEIFEEWLKYVSKNISTENLDIDYDDEPTYVSPTCTIEVVPEHERDYYDILKYATVFINCDEDSSMNMSFKISKFYDGDWKVAGHSTKGLESLRNLSSFEVLIANLSAYDVPIELDEEHILDESLEIEDKPEATFS